ncbi:MAG: hypothetical protein EZS28_013527 [Streblomastix strix]|uniref:Uncharacterized protein n=1 Tax=Streblomastix strix TaxID=222440 RepID=A0A5J4W9C7_9EUKA|nr:MAG: hypothetical protein EZS28_013527 [Streblomastix strix]
MFQGQNPHKINDLFPSSYAIASSTHVLRQGELAYLRHQRFLDKCNLILGIDLSLIGIDKQVMDYWQDCTGLRALETELLDISIVITNVGISTRGDTAITDLSFSGKTLILAKIVHSQRIIMMKLSLTQLIDSFTKGEDDALLLLKANQSTTYTKTETDYLISQIEVGDVDLSGYMTLGTSQTITANKTFNNACRFISSIDGMATITGSSFIKPGADNTTVLLGAGGTKPFSEFADPVENTYLTQSEVDAKLTNYVTTTNNQSINGTKTFNANVNATGFVKTGKDDTSILLAGGGDQLFSSFGGIEDLTSQAFNRNYNAGTFDIVCLVKDDIAVMIYIPFPNHTVDKGCYLAITHSTGHIAQKSTNSTYIQCASATKVQ